MRCSGRFIAALLAASGALTLANSAEAQPFSIVSKSPTDGITLPPTGAALADEASAPEVNVAGLGALEGGQLIYLHERNVPLDGVSDALYLGADVIGLGASLGLQWIRLGDLPRYRKVSYSLALGTPNFSLGGTYNNFFSPNDQLDDLSSWDVGLLIRPSKFMSLGASIRDLDRPEFNGEDLPRRYDVGLGVRPLGDRLTLGADLLIDDRHGWNEARMSFVAQAEPLNGLVLLAGLGVPFGSGDVVGQLGLTLNTDYLGLGYTFGASDPLSRPDHLIHARLSTERYRSLTTPRARYVVLDLDERLNPRAEGLGALLQMSRRDPYLDLLALLSRVREDDGLRGIVLRVSGLNLGQARTDELRSALLEVRKSGKRVVAYFMDGGDTEYLLASVADRVYAVPQASFMVNGFTATRIYFGDTLAKLGVTVDVARVGAYKSAPDQFTSNDMSKAEREMLDALLDDSFKRYVTTLSQARNLSEDKIREVIATGILTAESARQAGLVDAIAYPDELPSLLRAAEGQGVEVVKEFPAPMAVPRRWGGRPKIAVIQIQGLIAEGRSRSDPLGAARIAGSETIVKQLERVLADTSVKALVLRIDSGGGSSLASDLIWRAVTRVRENKPVIVSMGDSAASGGYYIAVAGDEIWAEPTTITGSIGVFAMKPNLQPLFGKLGLNEVVLKRGERADLLSITRPWTEGEQKQMQALIDDFYQQFLTRVAEGRKLDKARVDAIGRGRVWSGAAAKEIGLVDRLGGLSDSIEAAKARAGLAGQEVDVDLVTDDQGLFDLSFATLEQHSQLISMARSLAPGWGLALFELGDGPLAVMPERIEVK